MQKADFSYIKCDAGFCRGGGYIATRTDAGFMSLRTNECEESLRKNPNPLGWKFHISIDDERENMIRAWDNLVPIFIKHRVNFIKLIRPECHCDDEHSESERGRQFTIYIEQNLEKNRDDWQSLINEITDKLVEQNIKPGYQNIIAKAIPGSNYFYYRNDKPQSLEATSPHTVASPAIDKEPAVIQPTDTANIIASNIQSGVPKLNLQRIIPRWTHKPMAAALNPSNSNERFLSELKVENTKQLEIKDFYEKSQLKISH